MITPDYTLTLVRIVAPNFVAAFETDGHTIWAAAPTIATCSTGPPRRPADTSTNRAGAPRHPADAAVQNPESFEVQRNGIRAFFYFDDRRPPDDLRGPRPTPRRKPISANSNPPFCNLELLALDGADQRDEQREQAMGFDGLFRGGNVLTGLAVGIGAAVIGPVIIPVLRPIAKSLLKAGLIAYDQGRVALAEFNEQTGDLLAEARAELGGHATDESDLAPEASASEAKKAKSQRSRRRAG